VSEVISPPDFHKQNCFGDKRYSGTNTKKIATNITTLRQNWLIIASGN